jgi:hypothetical protein
MTDRYDEGFADGLKFVAQLLRRSALIVEAPVHGDYGGNDKPIITAIARAGNVRLATQFRDVAALLETATKDSTK